MSHMATTNDTIPYLHWSAYTYIVVNVLFCHYIYHTRNIKLFNITIVSCTQYIVPKIALCTIILVTLLSLIIILYLRTTLTVL